MLSRRKLLRGASLGASGLILAPFMQSLAAKEKGAPRPKRIVFVLFDNGFHEMGSQPADLPLLTSTTRDVPLAPHQLPKDIEPLDPWKDRMTIVQGLTGRHINPNHGSGFGALSGATAGPGQKYRQAVAASIDATLAQLHPSVFPLVVLGIDPGRPETSTFYASSAWGPGRPIAAQCRPELAYESLFGSTGADRTHFATKKNLLDFVSGDIKRIQPLLDGAERAQLDHHLSALESLSLRQDRLSKMLAAGELTRYAPQLPKEPPTLMPDVLTAQFDIAAAALATGLTNTVTITSGLCAIRGNYRGFADLGTHAVGHNKTDPATGLEGRALLSQIRHYIAQQTAGLMRKLEAIPAGDGTLLDDTVVVFMSDSANRQHSNGGNWPVVLVGDWGGCLKSGHIVTYPMKGRGAEGWSRSGNAGEDNPTLNALYCTLLQALGAPHEHFNLDPAMRDLADRFGPLSELLPA